MIRCDNMPAFRSEILMALRNKLGVEDKFSVPYHAQSHGGVDRATQTIENLLRKFIVENKDWDLSSVLAILVVLP